MFFTALAILLSLWMLVKHGRRAVLVLAPSLVRVSADPAAPPRTPAQVAAGEALRALGFERLGARAERSPLRGLDLPSDAWVHRGVGAYADVLALSPRGGGPAYAYFLSGFDDGALVLTANHARLPQSGPAVLAGGLPGATLDGAWRAHQVAVARLAAAHGPPRADGLAARGDLARRWYRGPGRAELRRMFGMSLVSALVALLLFVGSVNLFMRALMH
ncbi:hypothetical protein [Anaeromyxobacter paludicola]|uniref:Uncharacterized protein n=1 Tax=Anaeromyxobacter paludicola TaxID=2918171 RepID=A0ABM7XD69_9BACT|nr:hypothetical protein [Anaeromyxobacter paludicola]BDG09756.1 hypothetical protein AMPC_28690 [Anaeromyxobacter paludicola]